MPKEENNFDEFVKQLQQEIVNKEIEDFNEYIVDLFHKPKNWGKPLTFDVSFFYKDCRDDTMEFFLTIKKGIIEKANFVTDGCGATVATGSQTTLLIEGKPIKFAESLKLEDIDLALKGLPEDHKHSLELAINTIKSLIKKYKNNKHYLNLI